MFEYLDFRCCMCPNSNHLQNTICPAGGPSKKPETSCRFVKTYIDDRGAFISITSGRSGESAFFTGSRRTIHAAAQRVESELLPVRGSFDRAQADLNAYAKEKQWMEATAECQQEMNGVIWAKT